MKPIVRFRVTLMRRMPAALERGALIGSGIAIAVVLSGASQPATLGISIVNLRNDRGVVRVCLSPHPQIFLKCETDPDASKISLPANEATNLRFDDLPPGTYALSIIHDENGNGELDKLLFIPREGFGFSGNPPIRTGPPRSEEVEFSLAAGVSQQRIRIHYLL